MIKKILNLLSHPAWKGIAALVGIFGLIGISVIIYFIRDTIILLIGWLNQPITTTRILLISLVIIPILILVIIYRLYITIKNKKSSIKPIYKKEWGVLWEIGKNKFGKVGLNGPFCPLHYYELEIELNKGIFAFTCKGPTSKEKHIIIGPNINELILPEDYKNVGHPDLQIKIDVIKRIEAENRQKLLNKK